jgi:hypothetical protein
MSASQTTVANKDATKSKANLVSLIKADGFQKLPYWLQIFLNELYVLRQTIHMQARLERQCELTGYVYALTTTNTINSQAFKNLSDLVNNAAEFSTVDALLSARKAA